MVKDQFGNPVTSGEVEASRTGHNVDATPQRKPVGPDGTVDFTFTDANTANGGTDTVTFEYFLDQFDNTAEDSDSSTTIKYSATGQGSDYVISLDGENTEATDYEPADAAVIPLFDTVANTTTGANDEDAVITIANGEIDQAVTLSVDNGALILDADRDHAVRGLFLGRRHAQRRRRPAGRLPDHRHQVGPRHADGRHRRSHRDGAAHRQGAGQRGLGSQRDPDRSGHGPARHQPDHLHRGRHRRLRQPGAWCGEQHLQQAGHRSRLLPGR